MTPSNDLSGEIDPLLREALDWIVQLTSGAATLDDADALREWRSRSPAHARAFAEATGLRRALKQAVREFEAAPAEQPSGAVVPLHGRQATSQGRIAIGRRTLIKGAIAASAAGYLAARPPFSLWPSIAELGADYRTGTGEQRHVALADGASLDLNTQTSITIRGTPQEQVVELISGEAAITTDAGAPRRVVVEAGNGRAAAVRANFTVRRTDDDVCVTCIDGTVHLEQSGQVAVLGARQQLTYSSRSLGPVVAVDPEVTAAWRDGLLVFHDTPLHLVIDEVNRYRPGKIVLVRSELGGRLVNGVFHVDRIAGVIEQFQQLGVSITALPGGIVVVS